MRTCDKLDGSYRSGSDSPYCFNVHTGLHFWSDIWPNPNVTLSHLVFHSQELLLKGKDSLGYLTLWWDQRNIGRRDVFDLCLTHGRYTVGGGCSWFILYNVFWCLSVCDFKYGPRTGISVTTSSMKNIFIVRFACFDLWMTPMKATSQSGLISLQSCSLNNICRWNFDLFKMWKLVSIQFFKTKKLQTEQVIFFFYHTNWI